jgi:hypothetical protein
MTKQRSLIRIAALAIAVSAALPAMAETLVETGRHHYIYFGDHDIYYAPETKTYFWLDHGRWQSGYALPSEYRGYVATRGVDIELDTDRPYERNDYVIEHYRNAPVVASEVPPPERQTTTTERMDPYGTTTTTTTTTTKHRYVYYGDRDIYFSPETSTYFWEQDGRWVSGTALPADFQPYVRSGGVQIELDTVRPYERNAYVIAHYKGHHDRDDD